MISKEIESAHGLIGELGQTFKEQSLQVLHKYFQRNGKRENTPSTHWMKPGQPSWQKQDKNIWKRNNYRPISPINIDADTLNSTLADGIQRNVKSILRHASWIYPRNANFVQP